LVFVIKFAIVANIQSVYDCHQKHNNAAAGQYLTVTVNFEMASKLSHTVAIAS